MSGVADVTHRRRRVAIIGGSFVALIGVAVLVVAAYSVYLNTPHYSHHALTIDNYSVVNDRELQIAVHVGAQDVVETPAVHEESDRITISMSVAEYNPGSGFKNLARYDYQVSVSLQAALGQRLVVDGVTGKPIPRS